MAASALARRTFADSRVRNICFALFFALICLVNVAAYRTDYPTLKDRLAFVHAFATNASIRLFYGKPYDLLSVGGYAAWRVGGVLAIAAALWGALAAVRALRAEEDAGRQELVLAGVLRRRDAYLASLLGVGAGALVLWLALLFGLLAGGLALGGSAYLALATLSPALVFAGAGALASQLASSRRQALLLCAGALTLALVLRVIADTSSGLQWLRWLTPLGWSEEMRPFAHAEPLVALLPLGTAAALIAGAGLIAVRRDVGSGLLRAGERAPVRLGGLSSPTALALRNERGSLAAWLLGTGFFALIVGLVSTAVTSASIPRNMREQLAKLGAVQITRPSGYIAFAFLFFVLSISLFACSQLAAARHEESEECLETLFALPIDRRRWLAGRLVLAIGGAAALSLAAGLCAWLGAAVQNAGVSLSSALEAGANCLPVALLFLGIAALAFAFVPRASTAVSYALVAVAFVWELFGGLLEVPHWLLELSPFQHVGFVPAQQFRADWAIAMLLAGALAAGLALWAFSRRDLMGA